MKKNNNQFFIPVTILLFFLLISCSTDVFAGNFSVIDVNTLDNQWVEDGTPGTYKKTITLTVGDTFTNIYDSLVESDTINPPKIIEDFSNILTNKGNGTFEVTAEGTATKTYIADGTNGWTKKTIYIISKAREVESLSVSTKSITMTTIEMQNVEIIIKAKIGSDKITVSNSNSEVAQVTESSLYQIVSETGKTSYTYKIKPLRPGTTTITVSSVADPSFMQTIQVTVMSPYLKPTNYVSSKSGKYSYTSMVGDLLSITKYHQINKPVKLQKIGISLDKRDIYCLRIGNPNAKKSVLVTAGIHGREYMNPYFVMDNIEEMLNNYDVMYSNKKYTYRELYDKVCLYVIPMVNPDGISIAQEGAKAIQNKTLRKNVIKIQKRLRISYSRWKGNARNVDLNRNFPSGWEKLPSKRKEGTSGSKAGSEPETKYLMSFVNKIKPSTVINYHSMGEIIYWGYAAKKSSTFYKQSVSLKKISSKLTGYYAMPAHKSKAKACGCFEDWLAYKKKIPNLCIETGYVACPLPKNQYNRLYKKNKRVIEEICNFFR